MTKELVASGPELEELNRQALARLGRGMTLVEALEDLRKEVADNLPPTPEAVVVPPMTADQKAALAEIVEVYGVVAPEEPRKLSMTELADIAAERKVIDTVIKFLGERKDKSIREAIANHFDRVAEEEDLVKDDTPTDRNGHYAIKQASTVNGVKVQRFPTGGGGELTMAAVQAAHDRDELTRAEYLACTKLPDVPRVLDEDGARRAIKKDPALAAKLAKIMTVKQPGTTVKVG